VKITRDGWGARIVSAEIESLEAGPRRLRVVGHDHHMEIGPLRRHIGEEGRSESLEVLGYAVSVLDLDPEHAVQRGDASVLRIDRLPDQKIRCRSSASAAPGSHARAGRPCSPRGGRCSRPGPRRPGPSGSGGLVIWLWRASTDVPRKNRATHSQRKIKKFGDVDEGVVSVICLPATGREA